MAIKDQDIAREREKVEFKRAMDPCPIDFSELQTTNPRANGEQKEYEGRDASNFNRRKKYNDEEEPQFTASFLTGELPVEPNRYRLVWSRHCPWANRISIAIDLLGLDKVISKGVVDPLRPAGVVGDWFFTLDPDEKDPVLGVHSLGECYRKADPAFDQRATVPALVDVKTGKVVNNDYHVLDAELAVAFKDYIAEDAPDIYPEELREDIDALNIILYADVNLAVNLAALVGTQEEYEFYYNKIFDRLDWLEERLSTRRYLMGDTITLPDIRLFVTLSRFDLVFYQKYFVNKSASSTIRISGITRRTSTRIRLSATTRTSIPCASASTTSIIHRLPTLSASCRRDPMTAAGRSRMTARRNSPDNLLR